MLPNPLLQRVPPADMSADLRDTWERVSAVTGDATFVEVAANHPRLFAWYRDSFYGEVFHGSQLDRQLLELVRLRLANVHGCAFCNKGDTADALAAGVTEAQIAALPEYETGPFSESEKAALALADVMVLTNARGRLSEALYRRLRAHFSDAEIFELGMIMAVLCGMAKFLFAFDLVEKEDYCPL